MTTTVKTENGQSKTAYVHNYKQTKIFSRHLWLTIIQKIRQISC